MPFIFGLIVLISTIVFCVLSGGRWFEAQDPNATGTKEFANSLNRVFGPFYMLGYFTVQTNLFLGIMLIIYACLPNSSRAGSFFMGSVSLITMTFVIYWAALAPGVEAYQWLNAYSLISSLFLHAINPILGFVVLIALRHYLVLNKRIIGVCSMYVSFFVAYHAILYGAGAVVGENGNVQGAHIYSFLDVQRILFIDLKNVPALAVFINVLILLFSPFILILVNYLWAKVLRISYIDNSYFAWMEKIKDKIRIKKSK
ncbi:MAG: hypothetical protein HDR43_01620 [Mycoplasma sp.]|nr:hypothetical protein [Mycoplasma sp.]